MKYKLETGMFSGLDIDQPRDTELLSNIPRHIRETRRNLTAIKVLRVDLEAGTDRGDLVFPDEITKVWLRSRNDLPERKKFFGVAYPEDAAVIVGAIAICPDWNFRPGAMLYLGNDYGKMTYSLTDTIAGIAITENLVMFNIFAQEYTGMFADFSKWIEEQKNEIIALKDQINISIEEFYIRLSQAYSDLERAVAEAEAAANDAKNSANDAKNEADRAKEEADRAQEIADSTVSQTGFYNTRGAFYVQTPIASGATVTLPIGYYPTRNTLYLAYAGSECIPAHVDPNAEFCYQEIGTVPTELSTQIRILFDAEVGQTFSIWVVPASAGRSIDVMQELLVEAEAAASASMDSASLSEASKVASGNSATASANSATQAAQSAQEIEDLFSGLDKVLLHNEQLSRSIWAVKSLPKSYFDPGQAFAIDKTLICDAYGTQALYIGDVDADTINTRTISVSPQRLVNPARLGNADTHADLPTTVTAGQAKWNRTAVVDDYAHVLADETMTGSPAVDWYVIDITDDNITWGNPVIINTSQYQAQSTSVDSNKLLVGGVATGTFGTSRNIDTSIIGGSTGIPTSGVVSDFVNDSLVAAPTASTGVRRTTFGGIVAHGYSFGQTFAENIDAVMMPEAFYAAAGSGTLMVRIPSPAATLPTSMYIDFLIGTTGDMTSVKFFGRAYDTTTELKWDIAWADVTTEGPTPRLESIRVARSLRNFYILFKSVNQSILGNALLVRDAFAYHGSNVQFSDGWVISAGTEPAWDEVKEVIINPYGSVSPHANSHSQAGADPLTPVQIGALAVSGGTLTGGLFVPTPSTTEYTSTRVMNVDMMRPYINRGAFSFAQVLNDTYSPGLWYYVNANNSQDLPPYTSVSARICVEKWPVSGEYLYSVTWQGISSPDFFRVYYNGTSWGEWVNIRRNVLSVSAPDTVTNSFTRARADAYPFVGYNSASNVTGTFALKLCTLSNNTSTKYSLDFTLCDSYYITTTISSRILLSAGFRNNNGIVELDVSNAVLTVLCGMTRIQSARLASIGTDVYLLINDTSATWKWPLISVNYAISSYNAVDTSDGWSVSVMQTELAWDNVYNVSINADSPWKGPTGGTINASGKVTSSGDLVSANNITSVSRISTGNYYVHSPAINGGSIIICGLNGKTMGITEIDRTGGRTTVCTYSAYGFGAMEFEDADFSIIVI